MNYLNDKLKVRLNLQSVELVIAVSFSQIIIMSLCNVEQCTLQRKLSEVSAHRLILRPNSELQFIWRKVVRQLCLNLKELTELASKALTSQHAAYRKCTPRPVMKYIRMQSHVLCVPCRCRSVHKHCGALS